MTDYLKKLQLQIIDRIRNVKNDPSDPDNFSYSKSLIDKGPEKIAKKVIEEAFEVCLASIEGNTHKNGKDQIIYESADLIYHLSILLISKNIDIEDIFTELKNREK
jgi:phosphoribosyl-ATP pyrophosphohydrolase